MQIRDIRGVLDSQDNEVEGKATDAIGIDDAQDILLDSTRRLTLTDICCSMPPRKTADRYLFAFFNAKHVTARECRVHLSSEHMLIALQLYCTGVVS